VAIHGLTHSVKCGLTAVGFLCNSDVGLTRLLKILTYLLRLRRQNECCVNESASRIIHVEL